MIRNEICLLFYFWFSLNKSSYSIELRIKYVFDLEFNLLDDKWWTHYVKNSMWKSCEFCNDGSWGFVSKHYIYNERFAEIKTKKLFTQILMNNFVINYFLPLLMIKFDQKIFNYQRTIDLVVEHEINMINNNLNNTLIF